MSRDLVPEDIYEYTELREVAVSPDGERVAFVAHGFEESEDRRRPGGRHATPGEVLHGPLGPFRSA